MRPSILWFTSLMTAMGQEPGASLGSPRQVAGPQTLRPFSSDFLRPLAESWIKNRAVLIETSTHMKTAVTGSGLPPMQQCQYPPLSHMKLFYVMHNVRITKS